MKTLLILTVVTVLAACAAPRDSTNSLELGMSPEEVRAVMGTPDSTQASEAQTCYMYSMWRDFWNRQPGNYSDRYYTCFNGNKLVSYGNKED